MALFPDVSENGKAALVDRFVSMVRRDRLIGPLFNRGNRDWE